jgi:hypothetical protein
VVRPASNKKKCSVVVLKSFCTNNQSSIKKNGIKLFRKARINTRGCYNKQHNFYHCVMVYVTSTSVSVGTMVVNYQQTINKNESAPDLYIGLRTCNCLKRLGFKRFCIIRLSCCENGIKQRRLCIHVQEKDKKNCLPPRHRDIHRRGTG